MSNPKSNKQPLTRNKRKIDFKIKNLWSGSKGSHAKCPCLPVLTISDPEALDTFQRDI